MNYNELEKTGIKVYSVLGLTHAGRDGAQVVLADDLERFLLQERFVPKVKETKVKQ